MFRSTKGASKQRRDLINNEISLLRDLLPLPEAARQRLSQLQIMSMSCVFIRKCNFFSRIFGDGDLTRELSHDFSQTITGFILVASRDGKLLYISDNVTEYLGHSMVDMMTQGDSLYDIIDKRDHSLVQSNLVSGPQTGSPADPARTGSPTGQARPRDDRTFFCRMNVARSFRRQSGFGDHKMMHVRGHFVQPVLRDHYGNQPVFMAICSPLITPDVKETAVQNSTSTFYSVHSLGMKYTELGHVGHHHLGYTEAEMVGQSWYSLLHPEDVHEAKEKHVQLIKSSHEMGCMLTARLQSKAGAWVWVNIVMHIRQPFGCENGEPAIVCINQVIEDEEAQHYKVQSQLYSSHIARSPEFMGSPPGASPQHHTITQVNTEGGAYPPQVYMEPQPQGEEGLMYPVEFLADTSRGSQQQSTLADEQQRTQQQQQQPQYSDSLSSDSNSPQDPQSTRRQEVRQKLKRKLTDTSSANQCRPAKIPSSGSASPRGSSAGYHGSAIITNVSLVDKYSNSLQAMSSGDIQVLAPVRDGPVYQNLVLKKDVVLRQSAGRIAVVEATPSRIPVIPTFVKPPTPLTPDSVTCDVNTTALTVDVSAEPLIPACLLTPEASPQSVVHPDLSGSPPPQTLDFGASDVQTDASFFDDFVQLKQLTEAPRVVIDRPPPEGRLPVIDCVSLEKMLCDLEEIPTGDLPLSSPPPEPLTQQPESVCLPAAASPDPLLTEVVTTAVREMVQLAAEGALDLAQLTADGGLDLSQLMGGGGVQYPAPQADSADLLLKSEDGLGMTLEASLVAGSEDLLEELRQLTELDLPQPPAYADCDITSSLLA